jgi:hypothetical protein
VWGQQWAPKYGREYGCPPVQAQRPSLSPALLATHTHTRVCVQMAFVNSVWTPRGGSHVNLVASQVNNGAYPNWSFFL